MFRSAVLDITNLIRLWLKNSNIPIQLLWRHRRPREVTIKKSMNRWKATSCHFIDINSNVYDEIYCTAHLLPVKYYKNLSIISQSCKHTHLFEMMYLLYFRRYVNFVLQTYCNWTLDDPIFARIFFRKKLIFGTFFATYWTYFA